MCNLEDPPDFLPFEMQICSMSRFFSAMSQNYVILSQESLPIPSLPKQALLESSVPVEKHKTTELLQFARQLKTNCKCREQV